jgi:hypothetical protein
MHPLSAPMTAVVALFLAALAACSPALNWRDVHVDQTRLNLLLPCKPDRIQKTVPLGGPLVQLAMAGCDAAGATFAVAVADLGDPARVGPVLTQWQALTLANMKASPAPVALVQGALTPPASASGATAAGLAGPPTRVLQLDVAGASSDPAPVLLHARGQRPDGTAVSGHAAFFAQGSQVFQAVLYADRIAPEVSETFFSSLRFQ